MAEALFLFLEIYTKGATLSDKVVDKNTTEALKGWIACRSLTTTTTESQSILVRRLLSTTLRNSLNARQNCYILMISDEGLKSRAMSMSMSTTLYYMPFVHDLSCGM